MNKILATASPVTIVNSVFGDVKAWLLGIFLTVTVAIVIWHAIEYQKGSEDEKVKAIKNMKSKLFMAGGVFVLIWLVTYVFTKFSVLK